MDLAFFVAEEVHVFEKLASTLRVLPRHGWHRVGLKMHLRCRLLHSDSGNRVGHVCWIWLRRKSAGFQEFDRIVSRDLNVGRWGCLGEYGIYGCHG